MRILAILGLIGMTACTTTLNGTSSLRDVVQPAEYPPASYVADSYIDSRGCLYMRAGHSGTVKWVPRVRRDRQALCGYVPSLVSAEPQ